MIHHSGKTGLFLITGLLVCLLLVAGVSARAGGEETAGIAASPQQVEKINELWGKEMTAAEYLAQVHPDLYREMPERVREDLGTRPMRWESARSGESFTDSTRLMANRIDVTAAYGKTATRISYSGRAATLVPVSYLYVEAFLRNDAGQTVSSTSWHTAGNEVMATNTLYNPAPDSYIVHAWGYASSPYMEDSEDTGWINFP